MWTGHKSITLSFKYTAQHHTMALSDFETDTLYARVLRV